MKQILIGTTNPSKITRFQDLLAGEDVAFLTLRDLKITAEPPETGATPEENARIKAAFYGQFCEYVICGDSGLYFDGLPLSDPRQAGLHVRAPKGVRLDDDEMIAYYAALVRSLGSPVLAYYLDGVAVMAKGRLSSFMEDGEAARENAFYMTDIPSEKRHAGWPLDSLSLDRHNRCYFVDAEASGTDLAAENVILGAYRERLRAFLKDALFLNR